MRSRLKTAALIAASWSVFGILLGEQVYMLRGSGSVLNSWVRAVGFELNYCFVWAVTTPLILQLGHIFPLRRGRLWVSLCIHLVLSVAVAASVQATHVALLSLRNAAVFPMPPLNGLGRSVLMTIDYGCILYWVVLLIGQSIQYVKHYNAAQVRQAQLQEELAEAQLQALRMQMHPHFLFNALNSVSELIYENPSAAERMIGRLSELLRIYLRTSERQEISLAQEVKFVERYLEVQKMRFEEKLTIRITLDPASESACVPALILQPLVENAVIHGVADCEADGTVEIKAAVNQSLLELRVADNGAGLREGSGGFREGIGIRNTRRRLQRMYGDRHTLIIEGLPGGGTQALISIPFKQHSNGRELWLS